MGCRSSSQEHRRDPGEDSKELLLGWISEGKGRQEQPSATVEVRKADEVSANVLGDSEAAWVTQQQCNAELSNFLPPAPSEQTGSQMAFPGLGGHL